MLAPGSQMLPDREMDDLVGYALGFWPNAR